MTKNEIINWFWNKYNSCYPVLHNEFPNKIFMFYDEQFIRKIKLSKISGKKIIFPSKVKGICMFYQDWTNQRFYYDYDEIYLFLKSNYNDNYMIINNFIKDRLNEAEKMSVLTPRSIRIVVNAPLNEAEKMNVLTPVIYSQNEISRLNEAEKMNVLTPLTQTIEKHAELNEAEKMNVLTPFYYFNPLDHLLNEAEKMNVLTPMITHGVKH